MIILAVISFALFWVLLGYAIGRYFEDRKRDIKAVNQAAKAYEKGYNQGAENGYYQGHLDGARGRANRGVGERHN